MGLWATIVRWHDCSPQLSLAEESTEVFGDMEIISAALTQIVRRNNRDAKMIRLCLTEPLPK
jgi:hypothetical protein